jgi:hypothetical protein
MKESHQNRKEEGLTSRKGVYIVGGRRISIGCYILLEKYDGKG